MGGIVAVGGLLAVLGCVPALRAPEPLPSAPDAPPSVSDPRAEALWGTRAPGAVREAAEAFEARLARGVEPAASAVSAARAWTWLARHEDGAEARREAAGRAVRAAQWCGEAVPDEPACGYWLAAALGVQAEQRRSTAIDALPRIEALFEESAARIPGYESGGPERALALLYVRAPGFPVGPGDPDLGLEYARAAVGRAPGFAPNLAALAEALEAVGERDDALAAWERAEERAAVAVAAGDPDSGEWLDEARAALARLRR